MEYFGHAIIYTEIDLSSTYNLICIKKGDEWKIVFLIRYGNFEINAMPFWLTNAPTILQHLMKVIFWEFIDKFVVYYLDDIMIYSKNPEEHEQYVHLVSYGRPTIHSKVSHPSRLLSH